MDIPVHWSHKENVAWKQDIPGYGWSSPVHANGKLYLTTAVPRGERSDDGDADNKVSGVASDRDQSLRVICVNAKDGETVWNVQAFLQRAQDTPTIHSKNSHASPTPVLEAKRLYVHFGTSGTACLGVDGKVLWRNRSLKYDPRHGNGGSPAVVGSLLVINCDGANRQFVVAIDKRSGNVRWRVKRPPHSGRGFSFCTPLAIKVNGRVQIISPGSDSVSAYRPSDGSEIWRVRYPTGYSVVPRPVYGHGLVYICTGFGHGSLLAIRPDGKGDVTDTHVVWKTTAGVPRTPAPLLVGEHLYVISDRGIARCFRAKTGEEVWKERIGGAHSASPVFAEGRIYFQSEDGEGTVIAAGKEFKVLARNDMKERTLASYAVSDGTLFIRTKKHLYRIGKR